MGYYSQVPEALCTLPCNETCECIHSVTTNSVHAENVDSKNQTFHFKEVTKEKDEEAE